MRPLCRPQKLELDGAPAITEASYPYAYGVTATAPADLNGTTYDYGPIPLANGPHTIKATPTLGGITGAATSLKFTISD